MLTVKDLISMKDKIEQDKNKKYTLETSLGEILVRPPTSGDVAEAIANKDGLSINSAIIYACCLQPDLHSEELQKEFGAFSPEEIVSKIFSAGEINRIGDSLFDLAGYKSERIVAKLYSEVQKN